METTYRRCECQPRWHFKSKFESPESPSDLLRWKDSNGIQFTKLHDIKFFKKFLQVVETDEDGAGETTGWLEDVSSGFWLEGLTNVALKLILSYMCIEGKVQLELE